MTDKEYLKELGNRIRAARQLKGLTVVKLAYLSELDPSAFSSIQNGKKAPKITTLKRIAAALEIEMRDLV